VIRETESHRTALQEKERPPRCGHGESRQGILKPVTGQIAGLLAKKTQPKYYS
jgi:hypothetical protein